MPYYIRDPKRDPNFDNHPHASGLQGLQVWGFRVLGLGIQGALVKLALRSQVLPRGFVFNWLPEML